MVDQTLVHGSCLSFGEAGVLLLGPPGSGKSDLLLRLIDQEGWGISDTLKRAQLVSDDQVVIKLVNGRLVASAPAVIAGRLEIRGLGIVGLFHSTDTILAMAVRLTGCDTIDRLPDLEEGQFEILGVRLPTVMIDPASASAPARIRAALDWLNRN